MLLRFSLKTARDLFEKVKRDGELLEEEVNSDRFFNFVVTSYHLCEWIEKDLAIAATAKVEVSKIRNTGWIAACRDLANASKHFELKTGYRNQVVQDTSSKRGYGVGRYGHGGYGEGEEEIGTVLIDGTAHDALKIRDEVLKLWKDFFSRHGL